MGSSWKPVYLYYRQRQPSGGIEQKLSLQHTFLNNSDIGGRYSALSLPGIVPAAIIGVDVEILLLNAIAASQRKSGNFSGELAATERF
jgi:glucose-6-phosphate isomerase